MPSITERLKAAEMELESIRKEYDEEQRNKEGVIARPGDHVLHKTCGDRTVTNRKSYNHGILPTELPTLWQDKFFGLDTFDKYTTLDGRPVIGFRDNDE